MSRLEDMSDEELNQAYLDAHTRYNATRENVIHAKLGPHNEHRRSLERQLEDALLGIKNINEERKRRRVI